MGTRLFTLFLMTKKGYSVIHGLIENGFTSMIDKVITAQDKGVQNDYYEEIVSACKESGIPVYDRKEDVVITSSYCIAIGWRWLITLPDPSGLIVCHDSLLPKYRGFAPLVNMLINKEPYIGVTALFGSKEYDKGDIIDQDKIAVTYPIRIKDAIDLISPLYLRLVKKIFETVRQGKAFETRPQCEADSSYSLWRNEDDYHIDWTKSSSDIQQFIFSLGYPYKGASTLMGEDLIRVLDCELHDDVLIENRTPGKVIFMESNSPVVVCGKGLLKLTRVCREDGAPVLPMKSFRIKFT